MLKPIISLLSCLALAHAFKQGAPIEACEKRIPRHDSTVPTYNRGQYTFTYSPVGHNQYQIVIDGNGVPFKGFMVQALDSRNKTVGQFQGDSENIQVIRECNSVTHHNAKPKNKVSLLWTGPGRDVYFWATVVERYSKIYIDMLAQPASDNRQHQAPAAPHQQPHQQPESQPKRPIKDVVYDYYDYYYY